MIKTGIFGGAFDPPHNGHIRLAEEAAQQLKLKRLLIIPTYNAPHKDTAAASFDERMAMCTLAFGHIEGAEICDIERELGGTSYTINTVRALKKLYPDSAFYLLIGGDMLFGFTKWFRYEALLNETKVCAVARDNDSFIDMMEFANEIGKVKVLPTRAVEVSSTEIRAGLRSGGDVSQLMPESVIGYIGAHGLYK